MIPEFKADADIREWNISDIDILYNIIRVGLMDITVMFMLVYSFNHEWGIYGFVCDIIQ